MESLSVKLPVVLMTGHGDIPMSVQGTKAGAVDFLTKPFREPARRARIQRQLSPNTTTRPCNGGRGGEDEKARSQQGGTDSVQHPKNSSLGSGSLCSTERNTMCGR